MYSVIISSVLLVSLFTDGTAQDRSTLVESLTLHASFDNGIDADFSLEMVPYIHFPRYKKEMKGHLDELSVFDRALSKEEIQSVYNSENGISDLY